VSRCERDGGAVSAFAVRVDHDLCEKGCFHMICRVTRRVTRAIRVGF
jgi:hypothetical protein